MIMKTKCGVCRRVADKYADYCYGCKRIVCIFHFGGLKGPHTFETHKKKRHQRS